MWRNGSCFNVVMTTHIWGFCGSNPGFVAWIQTKAFQKNQPRLSPNCSEPERLASNGSRWNQQNTEAKDLKTLNLCKKNSRSSPLCKCWGPDQTIRWRPQAVAGWGAFLAMAGIRLSVCWIHSAWGGKTMVSTTKKTTIPNLQKPSFVGRWACDVPIDYPETVISVHSVPILAG